MQWSLIVFYSVFLAWNYCVITLSFLFFLVVHGVLVLETGSARLSRFWREAIPYRADDHRSWARRAQQPVHRLRAWRGVRQRHCGHRAVGITAYGCVHYDACKKFCTLVFNIRILRLWFCSVLNQTGLFPYWHVWGLTMVWLARISRICFSIC